MAGLSTGTGDAGETSAGDGSRLRKDDPRIECLGALDEAASAIGFARVVADPAQLDILLAFAQQRLMNLSAALAAPDGSVSPPNAEDVASVERSSADLMRLAGGFRGFTMPGGGESAARLHLARVAVRRAERRLVALAAHAQPPAESLRFLNRLSDALYAAARFANAEAGIDEERWDAGLKP